MREEWQTRPFEDCIESVKHTRKIQRKDFLDSGQFPIVSQEAEFTNGYWDDEADVFKVNTPVVIFGDHTQVLKYVDFDFVLGADGVKILQPREFLCPKFFFYQLQAVDFTSLGYARHYRLLKVLELRYPPLREQQRIVGILDKAFDAIAIAKANTEKNLQNARAIFESYLNDVFTKRGEGWVEKTLGEVCTLRSGTTLPKEIEKPSGEIPYLKVADMNIIENLHGVTASSRYVNKCDVNTSNLLPIGTTIFPKRGGAILTNKKRLTKRVICADLNIMGVTPKSGLLPDFLYRYFLRLDLREINNGSSIPQINNYSIEPLSISFPRSTSEQKTIVAKLESLSEETHHLESVCLRKIAALAALKKSLLHQAFSGEL